MYIVSGCLAGIRCRFDGQSTPFEPVVALIREGKAIPFCPEVYGGLPTPRPPCEIRDGRVVDVDGVDRTEAFALGAEEGARIALLAGCTHAILKANSPSCGCGVVYDGTFSSVKVPGDGLFARRLKEAGIIIQSEEDYPL